jgi:type I restriction enzyme S subunit
MTSLPPSWVTSPLENVCDFIRGVAFRSTDKRYEPALGLVACLRTKNVQKEVDWSDIWYIPEHYVKHAHQQVRCCDVLISSANSYALVGKVALVKHLPSPTTFGAFIGVIRAANAIDADYLYFRLSAPDYQNLLRGTASQTTNISNISISRMLKLPFELPPLNEQRRIVAKLEALFQKSRAIRDKLDRLPRLLANLQKSILNAAFRGDLTREWRAQHAVSGAWKTTRLGDVAEVGTGSTPLRSRSEYYASEGVPWVTSAATGAPFVFSAREFVTPIAVSEHRLKVYPSGTLLVAMYGEGKTRGQVTELAIDATINQACAAIKVDESQALRIYVKFALQANYLEMRALAEGGNQPNLNLSKIRDVRLGLPCMDEQREIVQLLSKAVEAIQRVHGETCDGFEKARMIESVVLRKAFRGELVPQDPTDEPASVLLERIRAERAATGPSRRTRTKKLTSST